MATLKQLRTRVSSIKNIQRVTYAMQLVAAARVRQAQDAILAARPYAEHLGRVLAGLHSSWRCFNRRRTAVPLRHQLCGRSHSHDGRYRLGQ